ncbi:MAG: hypothetical protein ACXADF_18145 [Candidatus Thorarchaeota archaeon]|jgi:acetylornithine deacetylase/succinyl-diaminopimelate desuccinylase-like protein
MDKWEERFLRELVELDTNSDEKKNYAECAEAIKKYCEEAGLKVEVFDSKHDGKPQPNIVATLDAGAKETALLCTHYDVVPAGDVESWKKPPFKLTLVKDKAFGQHCCMRQCSKRANQERLIEDQLEATHLSKRRDWRSLGH